MWAEHIKNIRRTPEQEADLAERLRRMHARLDMPIEIVEGPHGVTARRDGNAGVGATRETALRELFDKENRDTVLPPLGDISPVDSCLADAEVIALMNASTAVVQIPDGSVRVEKGGIVGVGISLVDAVCDWCERLAAHLIKPNTESAR